MDRGTRPEMMKLSFLLLLAVAIALGSCARGQAEGLKKGFYKKSCPQAEETVRSIIWNHVSSNSELPAKLLRLFFHDCFVRVRTSKFCSRKGRGRQITCMRIRILDDRVVMPPS